MPLSRPADPAAAEHPPPPGRPEPFAVGARVRVRELDPPGHTRCPAYIRGRVGTVVRRDGDHAVPDVEAHSDERPAEPTYSVCFAAGELWGEDAERGASVCVDLWHRYLDTLPTFDENRAGRAFRAAAERFARVRDRVTGDAERAGGLPRGPLVDDYIRSVRIACLRQRSSV